MNENTKAQRDEVTYSRSHRCLPTELKLKPKQSDFRVHALKPRKWAPLLSGAQDGHRGAGNPAAPSIVCLQWSQVSQGSDLAAAPEPMATPPQGATGDKAGVLMPPSGCHGEETSKCSLQGEWVYGRGPGSSLLPSLSPHRRHSAGCRHNRSLFY